MQTHPRDSSGFLHPQSARRRALGLWDGSRLIGRRLLAAERVLPDYLIIGAQKCGTSFLHQALAKHPAIRQDFMREVHYFDWNFERGTDWYRAHFPTRRQREQALSREGAFVTGEKSPFYLYDPAVPPRVRKLLPDVRLIVLLRDPVARALSHYHHSRRRGREDRPVEEAIAAQLDGAGQATREHTGELDRYRSYVDRGHYTRQLERWLALFDRQQIHVAFSERLFADPGAEIADIQRFLGLNPVIPENLTPVGQASYEPMPAGLQAQLRDAFADEPRQLAALLGEDPGWWQ